MERTQLAVTPSHNRTAPSLDAVTYMPPVDEYLTCITKSMKLIALITLDLQLKKDNLFFGQKKNNIIIPDLWIH